MAWKVPLGAEAGADLGRFLAQAPTNLQDIVIALSERLLAGPSDGATISALDPIWAISAGIDSRSNSRRFRPTNAPKRLDTALVLCSNDRRRPIAKRLRTRPGAADDRDHRE